VPAESEKRLRATVDAIMNEQSSMHAVWALLVGLYGKSKKRRDFIYARAGSFFGIMGDPLVDYVVLTVAKLLGLSPSRGKQELCLGKIETILRDMNETHLYRDLRKKYKRLKKDCSAIKAQRDNRIAHFGYEAHLESKPDMLPPLIRTQIEEVLRGIDGFMKKAWEVSMDSPYSFDPSRWDGATKDILTHLAQSARYKELQKDGTIRDPDDGLAKYKKILCLR